MHWRAPKLCRCNSGCYDYELVDAAGIFCAYVCEQCEPEVRKRYRPEIFNSSSRYAGTGAEEDIGYEADLMGDEDAQDT